VVSSLRRIDRHLERAGGAERQVTLVVAGSKNRYLTPILRIRKAKMSQSVFAGFLNVTTSTVQKWESPVSGQHPGGAAAKLLQIIEKDGIEALAV
jgi:DNA-binding transcriptional regulator YiaG